VPRLADLEEFPYVAQDEDSLGCVPACVSMVFSYLGLEYEQDALERDLDYSADTGTPFDNIGNLLGVRAIRVRSLTDAEEHIARGRPVIAAIWADRTVVSYTERVFQHAVVIVAIDAFEIRFSDPDSSWRLGTVNPLTCRRADFEAAWEAGFVLLRE
jgi:ABC-type bacteriocin/lantibiotic exporter with double-glycine peptidase domain